MIDVKSIIETKTYERPKGRFRPPSKADFSVRAKNLAWLLQTPLQETQGLLVRIYGYGDLHELQRDLEKAVKSPNDYPAGPFQEDLFAGFLVSEKDRGKFYQGNVPIASVRENYLIEVVFNLVGAKIGDKSAKKVSSRLWDIREIGLFSRPDTHRNQFRAVKAKHAALAAEPDGAAKSNAPSDYAYVGYASEGEAVLAFTRKGSAVFAALGELSEQLGNTGDVDEYLKSLAKIKKVHPNNPWVQAAQIVETAPYAWQGGWESHGPSETAWGLDVDPGYRRAAETNARHLLPVAERAIELFEDAFNGEHRKVASHKLMSFVGDDGNDTYSYLATLYWGGLAAMRAGNPRLAKKWLRANMAAIEGDNFGCRYYLGALNLNEGSGPVGALFSADDGSSWGAMLKTAEALRDGSFDKAAKSLKAALSFTPHLIRAFYPSFKDSDGIRVMGNIHSLATMQEFFHVTLKFWQENPEAHDALRAALSNPALRQAHVDLHKAKSACFGIALQPEKLASKNQALRHAAEEAFEAAFRRCDWLPSRAAPTP